MAHIVILAALPTEADALFAGQGARATLGPVPVRRLTVSGHAITIGECGVGKVNAAMAAALLAQQERADLLLMSGTCGKISDRSEHLFWLAEAVQHDYGAERPGGFAHYSAGAHPIGAHAIAPFAAMPDPGLGLPHARIASGDAFIECPDHARFLSEGLSADLVDMEVAAVAQVADRLGLPWGAVKATTDDANGDSAGDFLANVARASAAAAGAIERLVALHPKIG